jgi:RNA polymerase sigma-70 factor, ECF subfamily
VTEHEQQHVFHAWMTQYKGTIYKIVRAYARSAMDQDDLFQEVAIQIWHSVPAFRNACAVSTWLYRIALNTAMKWALKTEKHVREDIKDVEHILQETGTSADDRLAWLYEEITRLNVIDRSITLLLLDGFSYKEIAAIVGINESHVGVKINRIKKQLVHQSKKYSHGI